MQTTGHLIINGETILVLARLKVGRSRSWEDSYWSFKIRKSGKLGVFFSDESLYLQENAPKLSLLRQGKVIRC